MTTYIKKNKPELTIPKADPVTGVESLGIRFERPVLSGLVGVKHQLEQQAISSPQASARICAIAPGRADYIPPERHPQYSCQARQFGHPSLADRVIHHDLGLPPLPDLYQKSPRRNRNSSDDRWPPHFWLCFDNKPRLGAQVPQSPHPPVTKSLIGKRNHIIDNKPLAYCLRERPWYFECGATPLCPSPAA